MKMKRRKRTKWTEAFTCEHIKTYEKDKSRTLRKCLTYAFCLPLLYLYFLLFVCQMTISSFRTSKIPLKTFLLQSFKVKWLDEMRKYSPTTQHILKKKTHWLLGYPVRGFLSPDMAFFLVNIAADIKMRFIRKDVCVSPVMYIHTYIHTFVLSHEQ